MLWSRAIRRKCCPPWTTARLRPRRAIGSPSLNPGEHPGALARGPPYRSGADGDAVSPALSRGLLSCWATELQWHIFFATARSERHESAQECHDGDFLALHDTTSA